MGNLQDLRSVELERRQESAFPSADEQRRQRLASGRIVIATGGRDCTRDDLVYSALDRLRRERPITLLVHGACMDRSTGELLGADCLADLWARERYVKVEPRPPDWATWVPMQRWCAGSRFSTPARTDASSTPEPRSCSSAWPTRTGSRCGGHTADRLARSHINVRHVAN